MMHAFLVQAEQAMRAYGRFHGRLGSLYVEQIALIGRLQLQAYGDWLHLGLDHVRTLQADYVTDLRSPQQATGRGDGDTVTEPSGRANVICFAEALRRSGASVS